MKTKNKSQSAPDEFTAPGLEEAKKRLRYDTLAHKRSLLAFRSSVLN